MTDIQFRPVPYLFSTGNRCLFCDSPFVPLAVAAACQLLFLHGFYACLYFDLVLHHSG